MTALLAAAVLAADPPTLFPPRDFVEYWSAARVHLRGGDPYSGEQLLPLQREMYGRPDMDEVVSLWTPPWTLPLYWPFGALPPLEGHLLWVAVQVLAVVAGVWMAWRVYGGPTDRLWGLAPVGLAAGFGPVWWMVGYGQNTGLLVLGLGGFLYHRTRGRPYTAGAFAALTAIKPHLLAVFGVVLVVDALSRDGRRALLAGAGVLAALAAVALIPDPGVFQQFLDSARRPRTGAQVPLSHWALPTVGWWVRAWAAWDALKTDSGAGFWIQFVPTAVAALVAGGWRVRAGRRWDWAAALPWLVYGSALATPYGGWIFDLTVLLIPLTRTAARLARHPQMIPATIAVAGLLLVSLATLFVPAVAQQEFGFQYGLHHHVWLTPAVLGLDLLVIRMVPKAL
ncbi:MAG: glycosyltransferase family 87 protein [Gemmataceae bacterium]